ncbi:MAG: amidohydrolase [Parasporobacterium sp.]|nr:amidohydrolase [Parasporobacterium sp.]
MKKEILDGAIQLRRQLHADPELSLQEHQTKNRLIRFLREHTTFRIVDRGNWFYAVKQTDFASARVIAFRAEMDALPMEETLELPHQSRTPGVSHKCGHDGHMAALCGLALELEQHPAKNTVILIFQPGEETGQGALLCRELIREANISEIYAFHNLSGYPEGMVVFRSGITQPASEGIRIVLTGKPSHAAEPEQGRNPAGALAAIALFSQKLAAEEQEGMLLCTITGMQAGTGDFGISPGDGSICLTIRSDSESRMKELERRILEYAGEQAAQAGLSMEYRISDVFPETRNHLPCLEKVKQAAALAGIPVKEMEDLWRPSEDFGYYLKECPGAIFYIGNGGHYPAVHTDAYDFNDRILEPAVTVFRNLIDLM